ncbi:DEAD/DEAH box helicase [uncultured Solobacterium sp.]|uniref:DEAD/DEAH box helicase n=1 Tax=uncultured Solobacterium sp. TaxID=747375 RepID=UPI002622AD1D|nr:DEAD/DEAH box helicase [uncultured Solobacterium sp.]
MIFRKINYQDIQYEREQLKMLRDQLFSLRGQEKKNIQVIHDRCQDIIMDKVVEEVQQIPIKDLSKSFTRLPLQALEANHITTLYDLLKYNRRQLEALDGIGDETADKLMLALHRSTAAIKNQIHYRIDLEYLTDRDKEILQEIYFYLHTKENHAKLNEIYQETERGIQEAYDNSDLIQNFFGWIFSGRKKKQKFLTAVEDVKYFNQSSYAETIKQFYDNCTALKNVDFETILRDYKEHAIQYYTVIEKFSDIEIKDDVDEDIDVSLLKQIQATPLLLESFHMELRHYQEFGTKYILHQKRVLLGDEMGLGKTIQAIAAMNHLHHKGHRYFLVICPAGLLLNWKREIEKLTDMQAYMLHGTGISDFEIWKSDSGIAIVNYEGLDKIIFDKDFPLDMVVVDEAHFVKNKEAQRTRNTVRMIEQAEYALYMTGTAIENNVDEMCYLIECLNPSIASEVKDMKYLAKADLFRKKIAPVYLRRKRVDVLMELPELTIHDEWCMMNEEEIISYRKAVESGNFMAMRRVSWSSLNSTKAERMVELCLQALGEGRKVVIFSYFLETLSFVTDLLLGKSLPVISGKLSLEKRQEILRQFDEPVAQVLPIQINVGGIGLNIQTAEIVILCEPQLKPSDEMQAISRVYRMGQINHVFVYRLLSADTIDEVLVKRLHEKQNIFNQFADESEISDQLEQLKEDDIQTLIQSERKKLNH